MTHIKLLDENSMTQEIAYWFKNSIYGLISIGIIGSIIAVIILRIFAFFLKPVLLRFSKKYTMHMFKEGWILGRLSGENDSSKVAIYVLYNLFNFIVFSSILTISSLTLIIKLQLADSPPTNYPNVILLIISITSACLIGLKYWPLKMAHQTIILPLLGGKYAKDIVKTKE